MKENPGDIIILHMYTKNYDQMMYGSRDMVHRQMDGWTDGGWKKRHIEVGAPPKNRQNILQKHSQNKYLFKHFYFFCFISTQFADFDILTFAKSFNVLNNVA